MEKLVSVSCYCHIPSHVHMTKSDSYVLRHYAFEDGVLKRKVEYGSVINVPVFVFFSSESGGSA